MEEDPHVQITKIEDVTQFHNSIGLIGAFCCSLNIPELLQGPEAQPQRELTFPLEEL